MKINVFGKKRTSKEGRSFYTYLSTLTKKDGTEITCEVKFREEIGAPKKVPCTIEFDKKNANFVEKEDSYCKVDEVTGEVLEEFTTTRRTLWVSDYVESEYIDTSLDDFE